MSDANEFDEALVSAAFVSWHTEPSEDGAYIPMTQEEATRAFGRFLDEVKAAAWDEALEHVWKLSDPVRTIDTARGTREVLTSLDVTQAMSENPYRKDPE